LACPLALLPGLLAPALVPAQVGGVVPVCSPDKNSSAVIYGARPRHIGV